MEQIGLINGAIRLINGKRRLKLLVGTISPVYLLCEAGRLEAVSGNALRMQYAMPIVFPLCSVPPAVARPVSCDQNSTRTCITTLNFFPISFIRQVNTSIGGCRKNVYDVLGSGDYALRLHINAYLAHFTNYRLHDTALTCLTDRKSVV